MQFEELSPNAEKLLQEIIDHRNDNGIPDTGYWQMRFENLSFAESTRLRSLFKELRESELISTQWADGVPYFISITDKGFTYSEMKKRNEHINAVNGGIEMNYSLSPDALKLLREICMQATWPQSWIDGYWPKRLQGMNYSENIIFVEAANELLHNGLAQSVPFKTGGKILKVTQEGMEYDKELVMAEHRKEQMNEKAVPYSKMRKTYDVFISHASADKSDFVNSLWATISKLGINVFYDTDSLSWGDDWKAMLLRGTEQSEFAIIVISENFFGREWTERELNEFLKRQNESGQKIVLPLLHNITVDDLRKQYPEVADIQAIDTASYSKEEIAILFAKELIKRLKGL